jgi:hypothetical protein
VAKPRQMEGLTTHGWQTTQGFLPQLDEFYFTTAEKNNFGKLQMQCRISSITHSFQ